MERKTGDLLDNRGHASAQNLLREARELIEELEMDKNPRTVEGRVVSVQQALRVVRNQGQAVMDPGHVDELNQAYEQLRQNLRRL